ncbi:ABC transporter ATP-binding protein [Filimonas effusa]|uniref:ABC transporter ATP-binding protein n=1 Tax=Filimonas effusa TaxID=2508721 RepID=A0A4Q1D2A3_9BACT|nr:ABC transporter ATP-binding protein [Filimonas effusa]RXK81185.1 ABC transporter ATP-binding protein [Filimonas effusa]
MNFLEVSGVSKKAGKTFELEPLSFDLPRFRKLAIAGETGSGKSTLLKMIAGWISSDTGEIRFEGTRLKKIPDEKLIPGHPGIAYLSQHFELANFLTVEQVLSYANELSEAEAATVYEICRIDHLLERRTDQLSGGEKQRIALARLLVNAPRLLLLDEPFSNLDMIHKNLLKTVLHDVGEQLGITGILVSHDPQDTLSWADELIVLRAGAIVQQGTPQQLFHQPADTYVAGLFGKYNLLPVHTALPGLPPAQETKTHYMIRPVHLKITGDGWPAIVQQVRFFGNYEELDITTGDLQLLVHCDTGTARKGDTIRLSASPNNIWQL